MFFGTRMTPSQMDIDYFLSLMCVCVWNIEFRLPFEKSVRVVFSFSQFSSSFFFYCCGSADATKTKTTTKISKFTITIFTIEQNKLTN